MHIERWMPLLVGGVLHAQQPLTPAQRFTAVALSPDAAHLAWIGPTADGSARGVLLGGPHGEAARFIALPAADSASAAELTWSADGTQLLVRATNGGAPALWISGVSGGAARRVATIPGAVHAPRFSPDGARIALLYSSPAEWAGGPTAAVPRDTGVIGRSIDRQHLALVDVASGAFRTLGPGALFVHEFDWSPDGRELVASAAEGSGNANWYVSRLMSLGVDGRVREIARPTTQIAQPTWSPDGRTIAFVCGIMSDEGVTGGDLCTVPAAGGAIRDVTPRIALSFGSFAWTNASTLLTVATDHGRVQLARVDATTGRGTPLWTGDDWTSVGAAGGYPPRVSASRDGNAVALVRESFDAPPELWSGAPDRAWTQVTRANAGVRAPHGRVASVRWRSDSFDVQGYLVYPESFDASKKYPMVVDVHGGPASSWRPTFRVPNADDATLSRAGYFVFEPNPRGSHGAGQAFARANVRDFGYGDLRDVMSGVDSVIARFPVDSQRLGVTGGSYGGYMTMWAVTQTHRFRAAVAFAGIANWLSYVSETGIAEWMSPYFGTTPYDDPALFARHAPMTFVKNARTPTLVAVGERDTECPVPQSYEFARALQHYGATADLIVYPDEGHGLRDPAHVRDLRARTVAWFDRYLKGPVP